VLAEHRVNIEACANVFGGIDLADGNGRAAIAGVNLFKVGGAGWIDERARHRIAGHTALKTVQFAGEFLFLPFAKKVDIGDNRAL
jgi:hypothetical protein